MNFLKIMLDYLCFLLWKVIPQALQLCCWASLSEKTASLLLPGKEAQGFLTLFPGVQMTSFQGLLFFNSIAHFKARGHRALPSPSVFLEQQLRTESLAERGSSLGHPKTPSGRAQAASQRKPEESHSQQSLPSAFQNPFGPREEIRRKGLLSPYRCLSGMVYIKKLFPQHPFDTLLLISTTAACKMNFMSKYF